MLVRNVKVPERRNYKYLEERELAHAGHSRAGADCQYCRACNQEYLYQKMILYAIQTMGQEIVNLVYMLLVAVYFVNKGSVK
jgi:hypothetical protein